MTQITDAISAVRALTGSAGDLSGNADEALYMLEKCGSIQDTILRLQWAESNHRVSGYKIKAAIDAVTKLTHNAKVEADGAAFCAGRASNDGLCPGASSENEQ